jgi:hypothetical protein
MSDDDPFPDVQDVIIDEPLCADAEPGAVLRWRRRGDLLEALVRREANGRSVTSWIPALKVSTHSSVHHATGTEAASDSLRS